MSKPERLFHCTTPKTAKRYGESGRIISPVRGFDTLEAAMAWCIKTHSSVIIEITGWDECDIHKLPDHHNMFGTAYWVDMDVINTKCVFSAEKDA
jgi:hypothetical protein